MSVEEIASENTTIEPGSENQTTTTTTEEIPKNNEAKVEAKVEEVSDKPTSKAKKRLTLQERLELAAQKKGKASEKTKKDLQKEKANDQKNENHTVQPNTNLDDQNISPETEEKSIDSISVISSDLEKLIPDELSSFKIQLIEEIKQYTQQQIDKAQHVNQSKITDLEKEIVKLNMLKRGSGNDKKANEDVSKKLQEKEQQVQELLDEGSKLSQKEVTLTQTIKKLKNHESELEDDIEKYEKTVEDLTGKVEKLENKLADFGKTTRALSEEKFAFETLQKKYDSLSIANDSLTDELKEIKFSKLDVQLEEALNKIKTEEKKYESMKEQYEKIEVLFKQQKEETSMANNNLRKDLKNKEDLLNEKNLELKRLEEKVEALRFENENAIPTEKIHTDSELIKQQYEQARENWKMIESSYLEKVADFERQIEEVQTLNIAYSKKIKILNNDIKQKTIDYAEVEESNQNMSNEIEILRKQVENLNHTNKTLSDNLELLKEEFAKEKDNFETKVRKLEDEKTNLEAKLQIRTSELNNSVSPNSFYLQDISSSSSMNFMKNLNNSGAPYAIGRSFSNNLNAGKRYSVQMGESSTTPRGSTSTSAFSFQKLNNMIPMTPQDKVLRHQSSMASMDTNEAEPLTIRYNGANNGASSNAATSTTTISSARTGMVGNNTLIDDVRNSSMVSFGSQDATGMDSFSMGTPQDEMPMGMDAEMDHMQNGMRTPIVANDEESSGMGMNVQFIKKLGTQVRMLELEVSNLRDESKALIEEKEAASKEIVRLLEDNERVKEVKEEVVERDGKISELEKKYQRVLVILGEKEERIGELNADVDDLKDLLRQQVQQMVEMQEKINALNKNTNG